MNENIGSSETTREALNMDFSEYTKAMLEISGTTSDGKGGVWKVGRKNKAGLVNRALGISQFGILSKEKREFLEWFIGFAEGDGCFTVEKNASEPYATALQFQFDQSDRKLLDKVKKGLGFGEIYPQPGKTYQRFWVSSFANVTSLVHLFNGNIILNKVQLRFERWLEAYNKRYMAISYTTSPILFKSRQPTVTLQSAWLAGFIDAEGSFHAHHRTKKPAAIRTKFFINQKFERPVLENIRDCLRRSVNIPITSTSPKLITTDVERNIHRFEFNSLPLFLALCQYLAKYPLRGRKRLVFYRWKYVIENRSLYKTTPPKVLNRYLKLIAGLQKSKN